MHSHFDEMLAMLENFKEVLILVVMEDALALERRLFIG